MSIPQHGHTVTDLVDFSQTVTDVNDRDAACLEQANDFKKALDIGFRQGGGWFVHDEDTGIERQCFGNLNPLAIAHRQRANFAPHIQTLRRTSMSVILSDSSSS